MDVRVSEKRDDVNDREDERDIAEPSALVEQPVRSRSVTEHLG